ncbi:MAG: IS1096 element passenger TnpR family protein [Elainellaceae cyanobacterium]
MTFDIRQLDNLSYDDAEPLLEDYIYDTVEQFVNSQEGRAYLKTHPECGNWIATFIEMGYLYGEMTPPTMTKGDAKELMESILPRKLTLLDPSEADDAIPELIAFWQFLDQDYGFRSAKAIIKYLRTLDTKFRDMMADPAKGGIAKSFILQGQQAGFDMTTQDGVSAFQEEYNRAIREGAANPRMPSGLGMLDNLMSSDEAPNGDMPPEAMLNGLLSAMSQLGIGLDSFQEEGMSPEEAIARLTNELEAELGDEEADELELLPEEAIAILEAQSITDTEPGTILKDFQTLLEFIGEDGLQVSNKQNLIPLKSLEDLNARLSDPIQIDLKRPIQKSYPPINGLYLLLRATGIGQIIGRGKKKFLVLNPTVLESWNQLNPTERYFTLLEAWLIRSHAELLGERLSGLNEGSKSIQFWTRIPDKGTTCKSFKEQSFNYFPELHNLALMKLFGLLHVESGKPEPGTGWRVKKIMRLPFGDAVMQIVMQAALQQGMMWESEENPNIPFGELQSSFKPYFPEWENNLATSLHEFRSGVYVFKVSLNGIWRRIAISADMNLAHLSREILESVEFDFDHLDMFVYQNQIGRTVEVSHPYADSMLSTNEVRVGDLPLEEGNSMAYIFDFGDWWEFDVQLEQIQTDNSQVGYAEIIESHGDAPKQYPDEDEWDDDED